MKFNTAFAIVTCFCVGFSTCIPAISFNAEVQKLLSESKSHNANPSNDDEVDLAPAFTAIMSMIDMDAAFELIGLETGCGKELREYLQGNFSYVIDDFYAEPGIMAVFAYINDNGVDTFYSIIGLLHLILGMKLPPFPYPTEDPRWNQEINLSPILPDLADEECTPEDQEQVAEILSRMIPVKRMLELIFELMAIDHSFISLIMRVREPDVIEGYHNFIVKDSAIDLGRRMEAEGINPKVILALWNVFFGLNRSEQN